MEARQALRRSLVAGALYDAVLGIGILIAGPGLLEALGTAAPDPFLVRLGAVPLVVLPVLYAAAARARDPDPFRAPVLWARLAGGATVLVLAAWLRPGAPGVYVAIGVLDFAWAALHAALWRR